MRRTKHLPLYTAITSRLPRRNWLGPARLHLSDKIVLDLFTMMAFGVMSASQLHKLYPMVFTTRGTPQPHRPGTDLPPLIPDGNGGWVYPMILGIYPMIGGSHFQKQWGTTPEARTEMEITDAKKLPWIFRNGGGEQALTTALQKLQDAGNSSDLGYKLIEPCRDIPVRWDLVMKDEPSVAVIPQRAFCRPPSHWAE
ncbi:hypothetical protein BDV97DRAFT_135530 [Delphinella strobiligena]|nr:hypothetical protein BDV97DRAFT_135530 [Delphinella strobiligena]